MPPTLSLALATTDLAFLLYWSLAGLAAAHIISLPHEWMYAGFGEPRVVAWNWSFLVPDLAFSATGLAAVAAARRAAPVWRPLALVSLICTSIAGGMAIAYWTLLGEFDPSWYLPNLLIFAWPLPFIVRLVRALGTPSHPHA